MTDAWEDSRQKSRPLIFTEVFTNMVLLQETAHFPALGKFSYPSRFRICHELKDSLLFNAILIRFFIKFNLLKISYDHSFPGFRKVIFFKHNEFSWIVPFWNNPFYRSLLRLEGGVCYGIYKALRVSRALLIKSRIRVISHVS